MFSDGLSACRRIASVSLLCAVLSPQPTRASTFELVEWRGHTVLLLRGAITQGAAARFADAMRSAPALPHGLPVLLLESPGGSVSEALQISALMDTRPFHTVVPDGAACASACASIVFIGGALRTVEHRGALGQHSCSRDGVPDSRCNEVLSRHAVENGVSHGAVMAFVGYAPPEDMIWFGREDIDGWGISRYFGEDLSGFEKSEPRVIEMLTGRTPPAQAAWRVDFREDGYEAFLRPVSDDKREMELNLFCNESLPGRLFLSLEFNGAASAFARVFRGLRVELDASAWEDAGPVIWQADELAGEVITEVPRDRIRPILTTSEALRFVIDLEPPYQPMIVTTRVGGSSDVLRFAANHCPSGALPGPRPPF